MTTDYTFTLPLVPLLNRYYRRGRNATYLSSEGREYKKTVAAMLHGTAPLTGAVAISARIYRARNAGDVDGYAKGLLDALQGVLYDDDKCVTALHLYKDLDRRNPRVEVRAWEMDGEEVTR